MKTNNKIPRMGSCSPALSALLMCFFPVTWADEQSPALELICAIRGLRCVLANDYGCDGTRMITESG
jgi:hypothetical protein